MFRRTACLDGLDAIDEGAPIGAAALLTGVTAHDRAGCDVHSLATQGAGWFRLAGGQAHNRLQ